MNHLLKIYVDDVNGVFDNIERGIEYKEGKLSFSSEKAEHDKELAEDEVTMKVIQNIANDIDDMVVMTIDMPSKYDNKKVPMLDVQVWLNENDAGKIFYSFYEAVS